MILESSLGSMAMAPEAAVFEGNTEIPSGRSSVATASKSGSQAQDTRFTNHAASSEELASKDGEHIRVEEANKSVEVTVVESEGGSKEERFYASSCRLWFPIHTYLLVIG